MFKRIFFATLLIFVRTILLPWYIVKNFIKLRKHRRTYKKLDTYGYERFTEQTPELVEKRSRMVQDMFTASSRCACDSSAS